jgi:hypothetical protein
MTKQIHRQRSRHAHFFDQTEDLRKNGNSDIIHMSLRIPRSGVWQSRGFGARLLRRFAPRNDGFRMYDVGCENKKDKSETRNSLPR